MAQSSLFVWSHPSRSLAGLGVHLPRAVLHLALLAGFVCVAYYPSLQAPFVFDDVSNIVVNPAVHPTGVGDLRRVFESPYSVDRPLALLTFSLNYLWGGLDVTGYHVVNVVIHLVNAGLLYWLLRLLVPATSSPSRSSRGPLEVERTAQLAFWGTTLWALHPVQTQAVTYVVQRMTSLATLFYLGAVILFVLYRRTALAGRYALPGIVACFVLGMASKPIVVTLPLMLVVLEWSCFEPTAARSRWMLLAAISAPIIIGLAYLSGQLPDWTRPYPGRDFSPLERLLTEPRVLWHYLSVWSWPWPSRLHLDYEFGVSRGLLVPLTTLPGLVALAAAGWLAWRIRERYALGAFAIAWFLLASAVEASFLNLELAFIHRLYLPSALLAAGILTCLPAGVFRRAGPVLILLLGGLTLSTMTRNAEWNSAPELWTADLERGASTHRALISRAVELNVLGRRDEVLGIFGQSLPNEHVSAAVVPSYERAVAYYLTGNYREAAARFDQHRERFGQSAVVTFYRGLIHMHQGERSAALAAVGSIDAQAPGHHYARVLEASLRLDEGNAQRAQFILASALEAIDPARVQDRDLVRMYLANALLELRRFDDAYQLYLDAVGLDPANYFAWTQIYRMQRAAGDHEHADSIRRFLRSRGATIPGEDPSLRR